MKIYTVQLSKTIELQFEQTQRLFYFSYFVYDDGFPSFYADVLAFERKWLAPLILFYPT